MSLWNAKRPRDAGRGPVLALFPRPVVAPVGGLLVTVDLPWRFGVGLASDFRSDLYLTWSR